VRGVTSNYDTFQTARATAAAIKARQVSPLEVLDACLARVDDLNSSINAVIWRNDDEARAVANEAGNALVKSDPGDLPPFFGVPIPIKDVTPVAGWPTTRGSWALPSTPSETSAPVVQALQRAGFILCARTNAPEFGAILTTENLRYGFTHNPWDLGVTPGGSSGGAAAAVAGGMFPIAQGNDGAGSVRVPASCCGLVGLKVSRGRVPSLYQSWEGAVVEGALTRDVADTAAVLDAISGPDRGQWYNAPAPPRPFLAEVGADPGQLRVGLIEEAPLGLEIERVCLEASREVAAVLEKLGHSIDVVTFQVPDDALVAFLRVVNTGLADYDVDWGKTEPHIRASVEAGRTVDSLSYVRSVHDLQRWTREFVGQWGRDFDILLSPTMTIIPPRVGEVLAAVHESAATGLPPIQVLQMSVLTGGFNMTGQPAISLPTRMSPSGVPIGAQLVGGPWEEATLLRVAAQLEQAIPWADRRPSL
jgi:amidase